jgi:hypothetical protein
VLVSDAQNNQEVWNGDSKSDHTQEVPPMNHNWEMVKLLDPKAGHDHFHITPY